MASNPFGPLLESKEFRCYLAMGKYATRMETVLGLALLFLLSFSSAGQWSYTNKNSSEERWGDVANKMCNGSKQSPIPLTYAGAIYDPNLKPISVYQSGNFSANEPFVMTNNGHTLVVTIASCRYFLNLQGTSDMKFCIHQYHFHWGNRSSVGSEHSIDGKFFPLEMHIVAFDTSLYATFSEASKGVNGLAVLGLVFQEDQNIPRNKTMLYNMGAFLQKVKEVEYPGLTANFAPFPVDALLDIGDANTRYFRYEGSLTTPPCTENVYWTVVATPVPVSPQQLEAMRFLHYASEETAKNMANNFRKLQSVNPDNVVVPRVVFRSWNAASRMVASSLVLLLLISLLI
ncbi:Carbonic anhydrase 2 [Taenia crassiceps]|uniref:Carbonic anhydrase n=1 Tax=Taenia crassiceps TaxID=6207 RepID=A0ABR4QBR5_9CEST